MTNNTYIDSKNEEWHLSSDEKVAAKLAKTCFGQLAIDLTKDDIIALAKLMGLEVKEKEE